jgi:hypothetical protein
MSKISLIALVGLFVVLTVCGCTTADNANVIEYCVEFNFKDGSLRCPYWDTMHAEDGIRGYKVCFKSNYTVLDRSDGLSGPMIGCDGNNINGDVDFRFILETNKYASVGFQIVTDYVEDRIRVSNNAKNVTTSFVTIQNRNYTYTTYDEDGIQNGILNTSLDGQLYLILTTDHMSLAETIAVFKSIRIVPITHTLYSSRGNYSLEPYNITFNFGGMDEYEVAESKGLDRIESQHSDDEQKISGWTGIANLELDRDAQTSIKIQITKPDVANPEAIVTAAQNYELAQMMVSTVIANTAEFNGRTWYSSRLQRDIARPIPINEITFRADLIEHIESVQVTFKNVPDAVINEFMSSLVITGYGTENVKENWYAYVSRVRSPSQNAEGISALKFIDIYYQNGIQYDTATGDLYEIWEMGSGEHQNIKLTQKAIESRAIRSGYYGPIPLPKNVSVTSPNGDPIT